MPAASDDLLARNLVQALPGAGGLRVGIDTVQVSGIDASLAAFGERFVARLFTAHEIATCGSSPSRRSERLAARFAAKEAAIKVFGLSDVGVDWRHIEVRNDAAGAPRLALHGRARAAAERLGATDIAVSLSHDGDHACAVVAALIPVPPSRSARSPSPSSVANP